MKKTVLSLLSLLLVAVLTGCGSAQQTSSNSYRVAIIQQLDHASLDEIAAAVTAELDRLADQNHTVITYTVDSGNNDPTVLKQLADQAVASGADVIIPIATLAAQTVVASTEDTDIPVIFAAVSDPENSGLTGYERVSGTSDALNTVFILEMMQKQNPDISKVGLLYSLSEDNSRTPAAEAKAYLEKQGVAFIEANGNTTDEIIQSVSYLISQGVEAVFTPTDNVVMAAELSVYETLAESGIPHYAGADSFVRNGAFATCGVNYTDLGTKTADYAYRAMTEGMKNMEDYYLMEGGIITVNTETAAVLHAEYSVFADMGQLVEVVTTED